jgi:hypothetical protein
VPEGSNGSVCKIEITKVTSSVQITSSAQKYASVAEWLGWGLQRPLHWFESSQKLMKDMKKLREETIKKWEASGLLDGLKGQINPEVAKLYECCKTSLIKEDKNEEPILPMSLKIAAATLGKDLVG